MSLLGNLRADVARLKNPGGQTISTDSIGLGPVLMAFFSPRFMPVALYRMAYACGKHHLRPIGKLFSLINFVIFGLEIGLDCEIGPGLYFPHTSGTVIGANKIGRNATIYHNVTVGAKRLDLAFDPTLRPDIGNNVTLGAGAKILGSLKINDNVMVAANCVVVIDVPSDCTITGIPGKILIKN